MPSLKIYLLGQFKLETGTRTIELSSRPAQSLLAYLALNAGVEQRREKLAYLLWPDSAERSARGYLRQAIWRIRKSFINASLIPENFFQINDISVTFDRYSDYWLDAGAILDLVDDSAIEVMIETARLFRGELLPGFYDEWVVMARDRLHAAYHQRMNWLIQHLIVAKRWDDLLIWSEEWIRLGYAPEPAFRGLMMAHASLGDQGMVNTTFRRCVESLDRELVLEPSIETVQLYEQILRGEFQERVVPPVRAPHMDQQIPEFLSDCSVCEIDQPIFVGRIQEIARLDRFLDLSLSGQGSIVFITGEIGSGKTALVDEFTRLAREANPDLIVVRGNCNAHTGRGDPYLPFREILELLAGDVAARWAAGAIDRDHAILLWNTLPLTVQAVVDDGPDLVDTFISGSVLVARAGRFATVGLDWFTRLEELVRQKKNTAVIPGTQQRNLFEQYARVLKAISIQAPITLILDDLQWADLGSINLLFHLGRDLIGSRILIVGAYRPEDIALGRDGERHPLVPLINEFQRDFGKISVSLGGTQNQEFVDTLLDQEPNQLSTAFREMLYRQTQGHPLFTIELLRGMQERGDLVQKKSGGWHEGRSLNWEMMPARVEAVIEERIGRLAQPQREILETASVEGQVFTAEVVSEACEINERKILKLLSQELDRKHRLIRTHSIQRLDNQLISAYQFRHSLFQKFIYSSLDEFERVYLHEQVGSILEERYPTDEQRATIAPQLARHFREARITLKAVHYLLLAGEKAVQLSAYREGITHLTEGLALLLTMSESLERDHHEFKIQRGLGMAWVGPKAYGEEVERAFTRTQQLCQKMGNTPELCGSLGQLAVLNFVRSDFQKAHQYAENALNLAQQIDDPIYVLLGHWYLGFISFYIGDFTSARSHMQQVIDYYDPDEHHLLLVRLRGSDAGVSALAYESCYLWYLGYPDQAIKKSQEVLTLAHELGHPFSMADVICFAGCWLSAVRQDALSLKIYAEELRAISKKTNLGGWLETGTSFLGEALAMSGQEREGIEKIQMGDDFNQALGVRCSHISSLRALADAQMKDGQLQPGLSTLDEAIALIDSTNEHHWEAEIYRLRGDTLLELGHEAAAEASYQKAIQVARNQEAKSWELRAAVKLASFWETKGNRDQAYTLLAEIYEWFTEGFETPDLIAARTLLEKLS